MPLLMCPNCNEGMQDVRRNEVQIDVCPKCRGVWLDRGELEKLPHSAREVEADYERERDSWSRQPPAPTAAALASRLRAPRQYKKKKGSPTCSKSSTERWLLCDAVWGRSRDCGSAPAESSWRWA
jgi:Zn-finger nucleic acid-binding protein